MIRVGSARAALCFALLLGCGLVNAACGGGAKHDLSEKQLSIAVDTQRPSLERCYQKALETSPYKQEIRMQAAIHIAPSGAVSDVELDGSGGLPGMVPCLREAIMAWRFPEAQDATHTSLPIIFKPQVVQQKPDDAVLQQAVTDALKGKK